MRVHDLFDFIENFTESQSFKAPYSPWIMNIGNLERTLDVNGQIIIVCIEPKNFNFDNKTIDFLNLSFLSLDDNGERNSFATNSNNFSSSIIGAVSNALLEKIKDFEYKALTFMAFDKIDRRMSLYERIVRNNLNKFGGSYLPNIKMHNGGKALIIFNKLDENIKNEFIDWLKTQNKI